MRDRQMPPTAWDWWWDDFLATWALIASGEGMRMALIAAIEDPANRAEAARVFVAGFLSGISTIAVLP